MFAIPSTPSGNLVNVGIGAVGFYFWMCVNGVFRGEWKVFANFLSSSGGSLG